VLTEKPVIDVVSADDIENLLSNWQSWPNSLKHKTFNGSWVLPFEMYDQRYYRGQINPYRAPEYRDLPVSIDINGDGLLDLVYSKAEIAFQSSGGNQDIVRWRGVEQYIVLRRADGFELAYKCRQNMNYLGSGNNYEYRYYGDCADTSYQPGSEPSFEMPWNPMNIMYQQVPNWTGQHPIKTNGDKAEYYGKAQDVFDYLYVDQWVNSTQRNTYDRQKPQFKDLNGDGLPDAIFFGYSDAGKTANGENTYMELNFVMYNNGHGFDMVAGCIQRPSWTQPNPLHYTVPYNGTGYNCY